MRFSAARQIPPMLTEPNGGTPVKYNTYKNTQQKISKLGLGCMRLPRLSAEGEAIDWEQAQRVVDLAYESGINYFDTAFGYHDGESERFIGAALKKYPRESFNLASKMPIWKLRDGAKPEDIFAQQLEKCQVEYFDFYLMHAVGDNDEELIKSIDLPGFMRSLKAQGRAKRIGFSFHGSPALLRRMCENYDCWEFVQLQLNYYDWYDNTAKEEYDILCEFGIPCIVMEPVRGGSLHTLNSDAKALLDEYAPDKSAASFAIRFAAELPDVLTVLSGMSNLEQVKDNISTINGDIDLSAEEHELLKKVALEFRRNFTVPCTACKYCISECPNGVDIPAVFAAYNKYSMSRDLDDFTDAYAKIPSDSNASACIACGACQSVCPQSIEIPKKLKKALELL